MEKSLASDNCTYYNRGIISILNINFILVIVTIAVLSISKLMNLFINTTCVYKKHFGVICPFCGGTRSAVNIIHLNFVEAFKYHPTTVLLFFALIVFDLTSIFKVVTHKDTSKLFRWFYIILFSYIGLTIVQYIVRIIMIYNHIPCDFMYLDL